MPPLKETALRFAHVTMTVTFVLPCGCASGLRRRVSTMDAVSDTQGVRREQLDLHRYCSAGDSAL